jgi:hypothetical protein
MTTNEIVSSWITKPSQGKMLTGLVCKSMLWCVEISSASLPLVKPCGECQAVIEVWVRSPFFHSGFWDPNPEIT